MKHFRISESPNYHFYDFFKQVIWGISDKRKQVQVALNIFSQEAAMGIQKHFHYGVGAVYRVQWILFVHQALQVP